MSKELKEVAGEDWRQFTAFCIESTKRMWYGKKQGLCINGKVYRVLSYKGKGEPPF